MKDKFKEFGCEFKNEAECEEELNDDGLSLDEVAEGHFEKDLE